MTERCNCNGTDYVCRACEAAVPDVEALHNDAIDHFREAVMGLIDDLRALDREYTAHVYKSCACGEDEARNPCFATAITTLEAQFK